jgi:hypothetical protein
MFRVTPMRHVKQNGHEMCLTRSAFRPTVLTVARHHSNYETNISLGIERDCDVVA